jgi:hypothetical protein
MGLTVLASCCRRIAEVDESKVEMSQYLVSQIPQLMRKFGSRPDGVVDLVLLLEAMELDVYLQLGETSVPHNCCILNHAHAHAVIGI